MEENKNNERIDEELKSGYLSKELLKELDWAYDYDAASTVNWLKQKISILFDAINEGKTIIIVSENLKIQDPTKLKQWATQRYPDVLDEFFQLREKF